MLDFTSALYLGFRHETESLEPWRRLSTGRPAALCQPPEHFRLASRLAELTACERVTLASSTLHVFWDLFGMLGTSAAIYLDAGTYPVARWGVERAAARGIPARKFVHYSVRSLGEHLARAERRLRPVVVADGFCPGCGRAAPLPGLLAAVEARDGLLVLDDTQSLGIFGSGPGRSAPYGSGGGGSLRLYDVSSPRILLVSSLAKAFGAGLAMLGGVRDLVERFEERSETRVHSSPPSLAVLHAAERALAINARSGDRIRGRLSRLAARLREDAPHACSAGIGGLFPVFAPELPDHLDVAAVHDRLLERGVRTVLHAGGNGRERDRLSLIVTAAHQAAEVDTAAAALRAVIAG